VRLFPRSLTPEQEALVRAITAASIFTLISALYCSPVAAQNNPVPFLNNPTVPAAIVPGGQDFKLAVNGAGFVSGATILWNGSPRTTVVSGTQLIATIPASDIVTASLVSITVENPNPGGGVSNPILFSVTAQTTSLAFTRSESEFDPGGNSWVSQPMGLVAGSNPADGTSVLVVADGKCPVLELCSNDNGTIVGVGELGPYHQNLVESPQAIVTGDFNGDGVLDIVTLGQLEPSAYPNPNPNLNLYAVISPGATTGLGFQPVNEFPLVSGTSAFPAPVVGDFNQDGHLDIVTCGESAVYFIPGNGDGTLGPAIVLSSTESSTEGGLVAGDFNGDGILDLAVTNSQLNTVSILLGDGNGNFKKSGDYATGASPGAVVTGDFNGDGKLDLAVLDGSGTSVSILLGTGDGTFGTNVEYTAGVNVSSLTLGDFNGDGILDIALSDLSGTQCANSASPANGCVNILLGNGDGTFPSQFSFPAGGGPMFIVTTGLVAASSTPIGRAGVAVANLLDNTVSIFSPLESAGGTGNPVPIITSISPQNALEGSGSFTLTVNGSNFISSSTISFGGQAEPTAFVSGSQLSAVIPASAIAKAGPVLVLVFTPAPDGGVAEASFTVFVPPPTISSMAPSIVVAGSPNFTLTIYGTNFVNGSIVNFNGVPRLTTFVNPTQVTTSVLLSDVASPVTINIFVANPVGVGGATSPSVPLTVVATNSQPTVGPLSPASATAGGQSFTLTISGAVFGPAPVVTFGSQTVNAAYQSPTQVQAAIPASAIAVAGTPLVTVANSGSLPSAVVSFTVNNPVPQGNLLSPSSAAAGGAAVPLNVTGSNFNASSSILINGAAVPTTYVSPTLLQAAIPASGLAQAGTLNISVTNPPPGGGTSSALPFMIDDYAVNTLTTSETVTAGQPAPFSLMFAPSNGTYSNSIMLAATGLPAGAKAVFLPSATIAAGSGATAITLNISTTSRSSALADPHLPMATKELTVLEEGTAMLMLLGLLLRFSHFGGRRLRFITGVLGGGDSAMSAGEIVTLLFLFTAAICGFQQGCGITGGPSTFSTPTITPADPAPINIAGNWTFSSTSSRFVAQRTFTGPIVQNGSSISGTLSISGSPCAQTGTLIGAVNASSITASLMENGQPVSLIGTVSSDGNSASGSYSAVAGGCTNGDAGTWTGTRSATGSNPNGTPAGTYTITVTGTSGTVSHSTSVTLTVM
jgi:hypothetical protein